MYKILTIIIAAIALLPVASGCGERSGSQSMVSSAPESMASETEDGIASAPEILILTISEGYTLPRIGMTLEKMGVCTAMEFIDEAQNGDYGDFPLVAAQIPDANRCYPLEGYLFPDTYEIYADDSPEAIIRRMLLNTEIKLTEDLRQAIRDSGYTADEVLAIASIIEKEALGPTYMPEISSVLHNRLNRGMRLQCDVTIVYVEGAVKPFITGDIDRYNDYYNTYKCKAIPAGAICNPGLAAIRAALYPADTDYLFFLTDEDNNYHFTAEWEEHEANVKKYIAPGVTPDSNAGVTPDSNAGVTPDSSASRLP